MAFWNNASVEPKRSHRFLVEFDLPGGTSTQIYATGCSKPSYELGETVHTFLGQNYYYPGRVSWSPVSVTLVDSASPDFDTLLQRLIKSSGYVTPDRVANSGNGAVDAPNGARTPNKFDAVSSLNSVRIKELDGDGVMLGEWVLNNAWAQSVSFSELNYGSEELMTVSVSFRYDWATYNTTSDLVG